MRNAIVTFEDKIILIREQKVILNSDVAALYGVETKRVNEAVKNDPDKFPGGYLMELTQQEKDGMIEIPDHLKKLKYSAQLPKAFAEKALYMIATILKSARATETISKIIETFAKLLDSNQHTTDSETTFELNLAVLKRETYSETNIRNKRII